MTPVADNFGATYKFYSKGLNGLSTCKSKKTFMASSSQHPCNQITASEPCPQWILQAPSHTKTWQHVSCPIQFTMEVDNFGMKYVGHEYGEHRNSLRENHEISEDWTEGLL